MHTDSGRALAWLAPGPDGWVLTVSVLLVNALVALLAALLAMALRPERVRGPWRRDFLALLGMGLLVPVVGPLLMLFDMLLFNRISRRHIATGAEHLPLSPYVPEDPRPLGHFGIGGAIHGLRAGALNTDKSIRALMAVEQQRSAQTSQVLFDTLGHPDESVRLTAAGLLDRRESRVLKLIRRIEQALADADGVTPGWLADLHMEAARLNAEMLYLRLAREGMANLYLQRWGHHLDQAEPHCSNTANWMLSKARWLQQSGRSGADTLYERALEAGAAPSRVVPFLAERCWQQRDYRALRELVVAGDLFAGLPIAGTLSRRWGKAP